jgi:arylsulfatase A-like enzyme
MHSLRYYTVHSGKWHAGGSCTASIPINRGFNKSIGYLSGEEDHYTQQVGNAIDLFEDTERERFAFFLSSLDRGS